MLPKKLGQSVVISARKKRVDHEHLNELVERRNELEQKMDWDSDEDEFYLDNGERYSREDAQDEINSIDDELENYGDEYGGWHHAEPKAGHPKKESNDDHNDWWESLDKKQQQEYLKLHPKSKYGRNYKDEDSEKAHQEKKEKAIHKALKNAEMSHFGDIAFEIATQKYLQKNSGAKRSRKGGLDHDAVMQEVQKLSPDELKQAMHEALDAAGHKIDDKKKVVDQWYKENYGK